MWPAPTKSVASLPYKKVRFYIEAIVNVVLVEMKLEWSENNNYSQRYAILKLESFGNRNFEKLPILRFLTGL